MSFRDGCNVKVFAGDTVVRDGIKYIIKFIESYAVATVVIAENIKTHTVETLLLRDIKKI